jgi:cobalt-zinc-cadmium efflux system protein
MHSHTHAFENEPHTHNQGKHSDRPFVMGILFNLIYVGFEMYYGYFSNSLSLIADAWHNLGDVAGLGVSLFAMRMAAIKPNKKYTYGFSKGTILASLFNAVILLIAVGSIGYEAVHRFFHSQVAQWQTISIIATLGIVINAATAFLFINKSELNSKAAFLHMAADAGVSAGVVLGGFLLKWTGFEWIDPLISLLICFVILSGTWKILRNSFRLSLDGVPSNIDLEAVKQLALSIPNVKDIHHIHIWAMSTTKNALTAHLLLQSPMQESETVKLKENIKHALYHINIQHATLELELEHTDDCEEC